MGAAKILPDILVVIGRTDQERRIVVIFPLHILILLSKVPDDMFGTIAFVLAAGMFAAGVFVLAAGKFAGGLGCAMCKSRMRGTAGLSCIPGMSEPRMRRTAGAESGTM